MKPKFFYYFCRRQNSEYISHIDLEDGTYLIKYEVTRRVSANDVKMYATEQMKKECINAKETT